MLSGEVTDLFLGCERCGKVLCDSSPRCLGSSHRQVHSGPFCCVLGQSASPSQFLSPSRSINGYKWVQTTRATRQKLLQARVTCNRRSYFPVAELELIMMMTNLLWTSIPSRGSHYSVITWKPGKLQHSYTVPLSRFTYFNCQSNKCRKFVWNQWSLCWDQSYDRSWDHETRDNEWFSTHHKSTLAHLLSQNAPSNPLLTKYLIGI